MSKVYVVTGAGPVGWSVAAQLAEQGRQVRLLTRSGSGPGHPLIERIRGDAKDPAVLRSVLAGAQAVFHCIHGSAYNASVWQAELPAAEHAVLAAAQEVGAVVVFPESLYSYSEPDSVMSEGSPRQATGGKRGVRTELLRARAASATPTVSVVSGDFFGPRARMAHAGERMVAPILAGKNVSVVGSSRQPHSFTYVPDLARAMIAAADQPSAWNAVWHAPTGPALTQKELAQAFAAAAGRPSPKVRVLPGWTLRAAGIFSADARELAEMLYQFERPFIMDSAASEAALGVTPPPL
ncbi:MAG: NAD-dependent epimerase/dehydratase family protein [Arthrobacter sp.]